MRLLVSLELRFKLERRTANRTDQLASGQSMDLIRVRQQLIKRLECRTAHLTSMISFCRHSKSPFIFSTGARLPMFLGLTNNFNQTMAISMPVPGSAPYTQQRTDRHPQIRLTASQAR